MLLNFWRHLYFFSVRIISTHEQAIESVALVLLVQQAILMFLTSHRDTDVG